MKRHVVRSNPSKNFKTEKNKKSCVKKQCCKEKKNDNAKEKIDDDDEEYEDDDEYDEDGDMKNLNDFDNVKINQKEGFRDLFKSAKDAVANKAKYTEQPLSISSKTRSNFAKEKINDCDSNERNNDNDSVKKNNDNNTSIKKNNDDNKVLIDADIKVEGDISHALKNILSYRTKT